MTVELNTLPEWITAHLSQDEPVQLFPRSKEQRELKRLIYDTVFERFLDHISEGGLGTEFINSDPREIQYGDFLSWIHRDAEREARYEEAQRIGTAAMAEKVMLISDGIDNPMEDVQRSALRVATREKLMKAWNRKRYGDRQQVDVTNNTVISIKNLLEQRDQQLLDAITPIEGECARVE